MLTQSTLTYTQKRARSIVADPKQTPRHAAVAGGFQRENTKNRATRNAPSLSRNVVQHSAVGNFPQSPVASALVGFAHIWLRVIRTSGHQVGAQLPRHCHDAFICGFQCDSSIYTLQARQTKPQ